MPWKPSGFALAVLRCTLPVSFGYVPMGMAFGLLLVEQGHAGFWAPLMGILIFAGAAQFMAIGLLSAQAGLLEVAMTTLVLNSRHVFYGLSLMKDLQATGWRRLYIIFGLTDETYSLLSTLLGKRSESSDSFAAGNDPSRLAFWVTAANHGYWILGCGLGALLGERLSIDTTGLEFTLPALFMVLVIEQARATRRWFPFLIAGFCAALGLVLVSSDKLLPVAIAMTLFLLLSGRPWFEGRCRA